MNSRKNSTKNNNNEFKGKLLKKQFSIHDRFSHKLNQFSYWFLIIGLSLIVVAFIPQIVLFICHNFKQNEPEIIKKSFELIIVLKSLLLSLGSGFVLAAVVTFVIKRIEIKELLGIHFLEDLTEQEHLINLSEYTKRAIRNSIDIMKFSKAEIEEADSFYNFVNQVILPIYLNVPHKRDFKKEIIVERNQDNTLWIWKDKTKYTIHNNKATEEKPIDFPLHFTTISSCKKADDEDNKLNKFVEFFTEKFSVEVDYVPLEKIRDKEDKIDEKYFHYERINEQYIKFEFFYKIKLDKL